VKDWEAYQMNFSPIPAKKLFKVGLIVALIGLNVLFYLGA